MTDKQMQFIAWLITTATDKCQTMDEVREMNKEIRKHSTGFKEEAAEQKKDELATALFLYRITWMFQNISGLYSILKPV